MHLCEAAPLKWSTTLISWWQTRTTQFYLLAAYPLRETSSVCVMCLKYGMIILIIIIISLGQILLSYVSNTQKSNCSNHYTLQTHIWPVACSFNWILGGSVFAIGFGCFSSIKKLLGRNEMRTREGKDRQVIRRVKISSKTILWPAVCEQRQTDLSRIIV